jgi:hypothetical protein
MQRLSMFRFHCPACGHVTELLIPDSGLPDDTNLSCSTCRQPLGAWGELQRGLERKSDLPEPDPPYGLGWGSAEPPCRARCITADREFLSGV